MLRFILLFISPFILFSHVMTFATPSTCKMDNSLMKLSDFLTECAKETTSITPSNDNGKKGFEDRIKIVVERMIQLGAIAAVFFLIWSGIQYTTAYGDDEKVKHAKSTATYALA